MMNVTKTRIRRMRRTRFGRMLLLVLSVCVCIWIPVLALRNAGIREEIGIRFCSLILYQYVPVLMDPDKQSIIEDPEETYDTAIQSDLDYERILAGTDEEATDLPQGQVTEQADQGAGTDIAEQADSATAVSGTIREVISREKLNDFDYLIQNFYTVDKTTTITGEQLNAGELLREDCSLTERTDEEPQILIYHTHASEDFIDSDPSDQNTTVVGVGQRLADLLEHTYGYHVYHDTGVYDTDRDRAYSVAEPYVRKILEEHPSIEVIIDLHRDAVGQETRLVTEQNGKSMAKIMFFNGLSHTTAMGDIEYLYNPYLKDNLAFSLQMQIAARERYPDFTRNIYLKGYRYNMHFLPKSLLIEVGAQTNTVEEAMNAMEPLADILNQVLRDN